MKEEKHPIKSGVSVQKELIKTHEIYSKMREVNKTFWFNTRSSSHQFVLVQI